MHVIGPIFVIALLIVGSIIYLLSRQVVRARRESYVRTYMFPPGQFFLVYLKGGRRNVAMPSQAVDDLWHEFILYTKNYDAFCRRAFGQFLHHSPAIVLNAADKPGNAGLRRVWWHACLEENINPRRPTRLPLLFALDKKLAIPGGFIYALDCNAVRRTSDHGSATVVNCGGDFSSTSVDGTTDGFGDSGSGNTVSGDAGSGGSSDSGSDGGGSSCSGGCSS